MDSSAPELYLEYLKNNCPSIDINTLPSHIKATLETTNWDEPTSALDWNNFAVVALLEADRSEDLSAKEFYLNMAMEALNQGLELQEHPLCIAHLTLICVMIGDIEQAVNIGFSNLIDTLQPAYNNKEKKLPGIVYLPWRNNNIQSDQEIIEIIATDNGYKQALVLLTEALCRTQLLFYNSYGLRLLHLYLQFLPNSITINLKLGIANIANDRWEGLLYLHRAAEIAPDFAPTLQALYLAYRDAKMIDTANYWLNFAHDLQQKNPDNLALKWAEIPADSPITYTIFETELLLAVAPSFRSIVTTVLLGEGDWFEKEMEFWRSAIKPGMTVIDVGANVGVYTFSAARKVGSEGKVIAVEPFAECVSCLEETCKINNINWVKIYAGAASDRIGTANLSLHNANELNEIVSEEVARSLEPGSFAEVKCFTLDSLIETENLTEVNFLKIDAEGHEMSVLAGCNSILELFSPTIMYENIAGSKGSNLPVAEYLQNKGYQLYYYQPYVQKVISIDSLENLPHQLNLIAIPSHKIPVTNILE